MKHSKCPAREKKMRQEKQKKRGWREREKSQDCCVTFKPKNYLEILLSVHALTSHADILHLDHEATKCKMCNRLCGKF